MTTYVSPNIVWGGMQTATVAEMKTRFQAVHDAIVGCGMVQTADTGQLDISAIAATIGTGDYGYRIYRFNDSVQGTYPIFFKLLFGSEGNTGITRFRFTTGTGTNGAGTLTGQVSVTKQAGYPWHGDGGSLTLCQIHSCHTDGYFMIVVGYNNPQLYYPGWAWSVSRTRDDVGTFDGRGNVIWSTTSWGNGTDHSIAFTRVAATAFSGPNHQHYCMSPGNPASSALTNGDLQLYPHFYNDPDIKQMWSQFSAIVTGVFTSAPTTFTATVQYGQARTYLGSLAAPRGEYNQAACRVMFLWE